MKEDRRGDIVQALAWLLLGLILLTGVWAVGAQERIAGQVIRLHVLAASDGAADQARKLRVRDAVLSHAETYLRGAESRSEAEAILRARLPDLRRAAASVLESEGCGDGVRLELAETDFPTRVYDGGYVGTGADGRGGAYSGAHRVQRDGFALPAGRYLALRVVIGPGAGRNWWCVVFPPLCGGGTEEKAEESKEPQSAELPEPLSAESETAAKPPQKKPLSAEPETGLEDVPPSEAREETAAAVVGELPAAPQRYEVRFRLVELWGRVRAALS